MQSIFLTACLATTKAASVAFVCGYLVWIAEENTTCESCLDNLRTIGSNSPLNMLIQRQDRGKLRYPKPSFVSLVLLIVEFCVSAIPLLPDRYVTSILIQNCKARFMKELKCSTCNSDKLCHLLLIKLLNPLLDNIGRRATDRHHRAKLLNYKPLSRKILKI